MRNQRITDSAWWGWYLILFLLNLVFKAIPALKGPILHPDGVIYLWAAQALENGDVDAAIRAYPMLIYPYIITLFHYFIEDWVLAGRTLSIIVSSLTVIPFYAMARRITPGLGAIFAAVALIMLPEFNAIGYCVIRDPLFIFLSMTAISGTIIMNDTRNPVWAWFTIIPLFMLPFLRLEGWIVLLLTGAWFFYSFKSICVSKSSIMNYLFVTLAVIIILLIIFLPEQCYIFTRFNKIIGTFLDIAFSQKGLMEIKAGLKQMERGVAFHYGNNFWRVARDHIYLIYGLGFAETFVSITGMPLMVIGGMGFFTLCKRKKWIFFLLLVPVFLMMVYVYYFSTGMMEDRFLLLPALIWLIFAGVWLPSLIKRISEYSWFSSFSSTGTGMILALILLLPLAWDSLTHHPRIDIPILKKAGSWAEEITHTLPGKEIAVNERRLAWYMERNQVIFVDHTDEKCLLDSLLLQKKSVILLLNMRDSYDKRLLDKINSLEGIQLRKFVDDGHYMVVAAQMVL